MHPSSFFMTGSLIAKIEYWTKRYTFSFQFWGKDNNNVFISRDDVEIASFGGEEDIITILKDTIAWCEKANPGNRYPKEITVIATV